MSALDDRIRELENQHFDAGLDLESAAIEFFLDHRQEIEGLAAGGCESAAALVKSVDRYFETFEAMDKAEISKIDSEFR
jgi:hypothetical protein